MNSHDIKEEKANIYIYKITMTLVIHSRTNLYIFKGSNNVEYETWHKCKKRTFFVLFYFTMLKTNNNILVKIIKYKY